MEDKEEFHIIKIARRRWYEWLLIVIWFFAEAVFLQAAIASRKELEQRAALVYWLIFGVLLLGGFVYWIVRRNRLI
ncbi:MAG: hypothetical protein ACOYYU_00425 [Chloroflexota bacterium]